MKIHISKKHNDDLFNKIQIFVCKLYGEKEIQDAYQARNNIFWRTLKKKKQVIGLSLLPPCKKSLILHVKRANYICNIWRQFSTPVMLLDPHQMQGWKEDFKLEWSDSPYPNDVAKFLVIRQAGHKISELDRDTQNIEDIDDFDDEENIGDNFGNNYDNEEDISWS